jgi:putative transposase
MSRLAPQRDAPQFQANMQGQRLPGGVQRFVACYFATRNHFSVPARRRSAPAILCQPLEAFEAWKSAANLT